MKTNRIFLAGGLAAVAAAGCGRPEPEPDRRMNILYIMTDDHTAQMMSCYDRRYASTPNLDRIAAEGVRFTNSFVANSLSGPSRACMLTGKHSHANGYTDNTLCPAFDASQQTFPKLLQEAGYETAVIGKWHLGSLPTGFDHWEIVPGQGDYYNPDFIRQTGDTVRVHGYLTNLITDRSIEWLEQGRDPEKPFCLLVHHKAQHRNWMADTCNLALYEDRTFPLPETFFDDYAGRPAAAAQEMSIASDVDMDPVYDLKMLKEGHPGRLKGAYEWILSRMDSAQRTAWDRFYDPIIEDFYARNPQGRERAEWKFNRYMRDYLKTLKSLDDNVGRLLRYLDESGLRRTRWWSTPRTRASTWVSTAGSTSASCTRSRCARRWSCACRAGPAATSSNWCRTSTTPRPSSSWPERRFPRTFRGVRCCRCCGANILPTGVRRSTTTSTSIRPSTWSSATTACARTAGN